MFGSIRHRTRRFREQGWLIDLAIEQVGPEWDQPRLSYITRPLGLNMSFERGVLRERLKSLNDYVPLFSRLAELREKRAREEESVGHLVSASINYLAAALLYAGAEWPIWEDDNETLLELEDKKEKMYEKYMAYSTRRIEKVRIPFGGSYLWGILHFPEGYSEGDTFPCLVSLPGMDSFKEALVAAYDDKMLLRKCAVLAVDGPGQGETLVRNKVRVGHKSFDLAGRAIFDFISRHKGIDGGRVAIHGVSMGSYWVLRAAAASKGYVACSSYASCYEPGMKTIFYRASPTFKERFMWMTGIEDEEKFDEFAASMTLDDVLGEIRIPTLLTVGSKDHLSPVRYAYEVYEKIRAPKTLDVYLGEKHRVSHPFAEDRMADWIMDRMNKKPFESAINEIPPLL